jgi:outer membrane protein assembly factor BamB
MSRVLPFALALTIVFSQISRADWPQFRGPQSSGVAADTQLPTEWNEDQNVDWRIELPGRGPSSPIVVSGRVYLTATTGVKHDRLHVLCYDAESGERQWERQFWATGRTATHGSISGAAPTPASDGQRIFAFYSSNDLICLDLDGNLQWFRGLSYDYPKSGNDIGMASSPAVVDGVVVVQVESQGESFGAGIDAETGENLWRIERSRKSNWSSPTVLPGRGGRQNAVLLQSRDRLTAHDPKTGEQLWQMEEECGGTPSSIFTGNLLLTPMNGLTALRFSDESNSPEILWESNRLRPGAPSPIVYEDRVYTISGAILKCGDANTGDTVWQLRLKGNHWATPVIANDHLYSVNYDGQLHVVRLDKTAGEIVGLAEFEQPIHATPAISGNALYLRCDKYLWKISKS